MSSKSEKMHKDVQEKYLRVYDKQADAIFRHCYFRISDKEIALDLMQETFTKTWEYISKGGEVTNIRAFLYKVANNLLIDQYRKKKSISLEAIHETGFEFASKNADQDIKTKVDANLALRYLDVLEDDSKQVLLMRYVDDMKVKDIAEIIGETENAVSVRIHRALKKIQEQI
ncbi:MAG: sigma-70 family RNA polymerase sigma factor [Candidatus Spechtbacteria bacterium]|nr:sigma-70 family RNA polymerase sigma factor [Candidatus Spechtbacteria bacterium]